MREKFKKLLFFYSRMMWYKGIMYGEIQKPLSYWNETLLIVLALKAYDISVSIQWIIGIYVAVFFLLVIGGVFIVKIGLVKYNTQLGNFQNPELLRIIDKISEVEEKIK